MLINKTVVVRSTVSAVSRVRRLLSRLRMRLLRGAPFWKGPSCSLEELVVVFYEGGLGDAARQCVQGIRSM